MPFTSDTYDTSLNHEASGCYDYLLHEENYTEEQLDKMDNSELVNLAWTLSSKKAQKEKQKEIVSNLHKALHQTRELPQLYEAASSMVNAIVKIECYSYNAEEKGYFEILEELLFSFNEYGSDDACDTEENKAYRNMCTKITNAIKEYTKAV